MQSQTFIYNEIFNAFFGKKQKIRQINPNNHTFFSQQGEDIYIYYNFINKVASDGVFVELGAMDGIIYSNTKFFEDKLKFTGTLIEPTHLYNKLVLNRPNCKCYDVAINYDNSPAEFIGVSATSGLVSTMPCQIRGKRTNTYFVKGCPFNEILNKDNTEYIDLFTIDVEGGEQIILETFDFNIPIYVICIELDGNNEEKDENCRVILRKNGFDFNKKLCGNEFWINNNYHRKHILFDESIKQNTTFSCISELGTFKYLEEHVINEVEDAIRNSF